MGFCEVYESDARDVAILEIYNSSLLYVSADLGLDRVVGMR